MLEQLFHGVQISSRWEALWHGVKFRVLEYPIGEIFVKTRSCKDFCPFLGQLLEKIFICKINDISFIESLFQRLDSTYLSGPMSEFHTGLVGLWCVMRSPCRLNGFGKWLFGNSSWLASSPILSWQAVAWLLVWHECMLFFKG